MFPAGPLPACRSMGQPVFSSWPLRHLIDENERHDPGAAAFLPGTLHSDVDLRRFPFPQMLGPHIPDTAKQMLVNPSIGQFSAK